MVAELAWRPAVAAALAAVVAAAAAEEAWNEPLRRVFHGEWSEERVDEVLGQSAVKLRE